MKAKWYLSTLVVVLTFLGICHNQISTPNQEILLQFNSDEVTTEQSQNAIANIEQQLRSFGIENIQVREDENGQLKIAYYSAVDIESIKKILSAESLNLDVASLKLDKNSSKKTSKDNQKDYNLDVYEIQKPADGNNSAGKFVVIVKQDYDRFLNSNFYPSFNQIDANQTHIVEKLSNSFFKDIAVAIQNTSHIIPEVRAGPKTSLWTV